MTPDIAYYYGITSQEWCGLESNVLSNVIRITYSGGVYTSQQAAAQGTANFDVVAPVDVQGLNVSSVRSGVNRLTWNASTDKGLWYYNIYYR